MTNEIAEETEQEEEEKFTEDPSSFGPQKGGRISQKEKIELEEREIAAQQALSTLFRIRQPNMTRRRRNEWKQKFLTELADVDDEDFRHLMSDPEVSAAIAEIFHSGAGTKPGEAIYDDKGREIDRVPYDANWMMENYEMVEWTPMKDGVIDVNGVPWRVFEGIPCKTPNIIRDVAQESYRQTRLAESMMKSALEDSPAKFADGTTVQAG